MRYVFYFFWRNSGSPSVCTFAGYKRFHVDKPYPLMIPYN
ncbi:hypothetical protein HMPREF1548_06179 [Clostridium sp. KLE 1755]|nr:hypothetical protein HMPREF1548_06179 [Clostridium sp. KLE 1755]